MVATPQAQVDEASGGRTATSREATPIQWFLRWSAATAIGPVSERLTSRLTVRGDLRKRGSAQE
jgi:hypothetical protein